MIVLGKLNLSASHIDTCFLLVDHEIIHLSLFLKVVLATFYLYSFYSLQKGELGDRTTGAFILDFFMDK